jgi:AcrR family transcriptional regulator
MGIAERKEREREEVKDLILNAAREIFLKDGYESTSIRKIAKRIEYSPGIIYHHFKDKNDLLLALHDKAFECKINALFTSVQHIADPAERLRATGIGYIEYGLSNPQDYELMFILRCPMEALALKEEFWQDGAASRRVISEAMSTSMICRSYSGARCTASSLSTIMKGSTSTRARTRNSF